MWTGHAAEGEKYKQYLMDHAAEFGLKAEDIAGMAHPVLMNMAAVDDERAVELGQYDVKDTESTEFARRVFQPWLLDVVNQLAPTVARS